jgi:diaminopimelate epimerase
MRSSKWRALGNSYLVVETEADARLDAARARDLSATTDGVLEVLRAGAADVEIIVWNPDGSRAELSGNGTRIAAAWLAERTGCRTVTVRVGSRVVTARILPDGSIEQDLGAIEVGPDEIVGGVTLRTVDVGNPHAVVVGEPGDIDRIGPLLETHERFPDRTNVQVVRVDGPGEVTARVWERGVGETESSGTSAAAVGAATHGAGTVVVHFPGGDLHVRIEGGRAFVTGPAERYD